MFYVEHLWIGTVFRGKRQGQRENLTRAVPKREQRATENKTRSRANALHLYILFFLETEDYPLLLGGT